jgi:hypothetical protein
MLLFLAFIILMASESQSKSVFFIITIASVYNVGAAIMKKLESMDLSKGLNNEIH